MEEGEREGDGYIIPKSMHISTVRNAKGEERLIEIHTTSNPSQ